MFERSHFRIFDNFKARPNINMKEALNLLEKLKVEYPNLRLSLTQEVDDKFVPTTYIYMDGEKIISWSTETAQALKTLHNVCVEDVMFENVKEGIEEYLKFKSENKDTSNKQEEKTETVEEYLERTEKRRKKENEEFSANRQKIADELTKRCSNLTPERFECQLAVSMNPFDLSPILGIRINGEVILTYTGDILNEPEEIINSAEHIIKQAYECNSILKTLQKEFPDLELVLCREIKYDNFKPNIYISVNGVKVVNINLEYFEDIKMQVENAEHEFATACKNTIRDYLKYSSSERESGAKDLHRKSFPI